MKKAFVFLPAAPDGPGEAVWDFVSEVVWKDLCPADDLSVILQEQKSILLQALSVLQALYGCQDQWHGTCDTSKADFSVAAHSHGRLFYERNPISSVPLCTLISAHFAPLHEGLALIGTILRLLQYHSDATRDADNGEEEKRDEHLQMLAETAAELLADICLQIPKVKPNVGNFNLSYILNVGL